MPVAVALDLRAVPDSGVIWGWLAVPVTCKCGDPACCAGGYEVVPRWDLRVHIFADDEPCWCKPTVAEDGTIVHSSADGREAFERGERKVS